MNKIMKTIPKLAAMRIGAITCVVDGACTYPLLDYGACITPGLFLGPALYLICRIWFPDSTSTKKYQNQRGDLYCAFEYHDVDGTTAVFVIFTLSPVGF
jgi:hypothetical protein